MDKPLDKMTLEELLDLILESPHKTMRSMAKTEVMRREKKFRKSVEDALKEIEEDGRLGYPTATVDVNAPLALIQCALEHQMRALKYVLIALDVKDGKNG